MDLERVAIVGASLAGLSAAATFRDAGWDGHLVVVDGSEQLPTDRPPLSKGVLSGDRGVDDIGQPLASRLDDLDVDLRLGQWVDGFAADDLRLKLTNDDEIVADGVVIATGGSPRRLADTDGVEGIHVLRDVADSLALRRDLERIDGGRVAVVGAGFIGSEVAATCRGLGIDVTLIEAAEAPLDRAFPSEIGHRLADLHRDNGVDVRLGVGVEGVTGNGRVGGVRLTDGTTVDAEVVVVGIGVVPDTGWLDGSGVPCDNGVTCDSTLLAAPGVVAAGDVADFHNVLFGERMRVEHWDTAIAAGAAAADRLLAGARGTDGVPFAPVPWFWSDQYDVKIQMAGRPAATDEVVLIDGSYEDGRFAVAFRRGGDCRGVLAFGRPRAVVMAQMKMAESLAWDHVIGR